MLRPIAFRDTESRDFIPQAVIGRPVSYFTTSMNIQFFDGHDDLDDFQGAALVLNGRLPFLLKHYKWHPKDTITVYLPDDIQNIDQITDAILLIMQELRLSKGTLIWQRADNPDL
jgi:hypothetical protein